MNALIGIEVTRILSELSRPEAYDHPVSNLHSVQTHTSCVFLTGKYAYKVKKPVNFKFLDYSTPELRHESCEREVILNRRLCPELYLAVVPVTEWQGQLRLGGPGTTVDWAVKMRQLPEPDMLPARLIQDSVSTAQMERIARLLASFHENAETNAEIQAFGTPERIRVNLQENFEQTGKFVNGSLTGDHVKDIRSYSEDFLEKHRALFLNRVESGRIRNGHGDLRAQNICLYPHLQQGIQIFDCIEFNDRFRYEDVAADLAYLAMDLDLSGRADLREVLIDEYVRASNDQELTSLLLFYQCYRAFVRGKIALFASIESEIPMEQRQDHEKLAAAAVDLARSYAIHRSPALFITMGVSGSGKSIVARELARRLPAVLLSSDKIRKEVAGASPYLPLTSNWYRPGQIAMVYEELRKRARSFLQKGEHVILDATFLSDTERKASAAAAASCGATFRILECRCPEAVARARIEARTKLQSSTSDATVSVLNEQLKRYKPPEEQVTLLNTEEPAQLLARKVLNSL